MNEFADDNFEFDENGKRLFKRVDNIVGKGEIPHYEQFPPFRHCFQNTCTRDTLKQELVWERDNDIFNNTSPSALKYQCTPGVSYSSTLYISVSKTLVQSNDKTQVAFPHNHHGSH